MTIAIFPIDPLTAEIMKFKKTNIHKPITESIQEKGNRPELKEILMNAVSLLTIQIRIIGLKDFDR